MKIPPVVLEYETSRDPLRKTTTSAFQPIKAIESPDRMKKMSQDSNDVTEDFKVTAPVAFTYVETPSKMAALQPPKLVRQRTGEIIELEMP